MFGLVDGAGEKIAEISGDPLYTKIELTGTTHLVEEVRLLAPVIPRSKIMGIARNFSPPGESVKSERRAVPLIFLVPNTAVVGPGDPVVVPDFVHEVVHEAEMAVVIGRMCKNVPASEAASVIFGYTVANDVTARDLVESDDQWARAKGMDTFCPLGPWIETDLDTSDLRITCKVDGELRQDQSTQDLLHTIPELIEVLSAAFTLLPGDVILAGTPGGISQVFPGERVEVAVEGIGSFSNPFVSTD